MEQHYRTIWLSDLHLGSRACRVNLLLDFLRRTDCDTLYLVGDVVDLESLRSTFYWPTTHSEVLRLLWRKSQAGTQIVYVPGNHDVDLRSLVGAELGSVCITRQAIHTTSTGKRFLVLHGDEFDTVIRAPRIAEKLGVVAYDALLHMNRFAHWINELLGRPYWSLAQHVKNRVPKAQRYIHAFREACVRAARERGVDGVICGHIHRAELSEHGGIQYCNDGDWVESCSAVIEDQQGELELLLWRPETVVSPAAVPIRHAA